jgi:hypothetical protein
MWGNTLGWSISAVLVGLTISLVVYLDRTGRISTPRTDFSQKTGAGGEIRLPVPPSVVLSKLDDSIDSTEIYRRAILKYNEDPFTYGRFVRAGRERDIADLPAIKILHEAAASSRADIFAASPATIVTMKSDIPDLQALLTLGQAARRAGQLIAKSKPDEAMALHRAAFALGAKLYTERLSFAELSIGLTLIAESAAAMRSLARDNGDTTFERGVAEFDTARINYVNDQIAPMNNVLRAVDQTVLETHFGDVLYFARNAEERMWRVEAIFALARYRFNAAKSADQTLAENTLRQLSDDEDPIVRLAARVGRDLTIEQYRMIH